MLRRRIGTAAVLAAVLSLAMDASARRRNDPPPDPTLVAVSQAKQDVQAKRRTLQDLDTKENRTLLEMNTLTQETTGAKDMNTIAWKLKRLEEVRKTYDETTEQKNVVSEDYRVAGENYIAAEDAYAAKNGKRYDPNEYVYWVNELRFYKARGAPTGQSVDKKDPPQTSETGGDPKTTAGGRLQRVQNQAQAAQLAVQQQAQRGQQGPQPGWTPGSSYGTSRAPGSFGGPAETQWLEKKVMLSQPLPQNRGGITLQSLDSIMGKLRSGNPRGALGEVDEALRRNPNDADAYALKAKILNKMHRYKEAEEAAKEAIRLNPNKTSAYEELTWAQLKQGKYEEAAESASRAIRVNPDSPHAYFLRALAYEGLGDRERMLVDLQRATAMDERYRQAYERAKAGKKLYDPEADDSYQLLESVTAPARGGSALPLLGMGLLLIVLALVIGVGVNLWKGVRRTQGDEFSRTLAAAQQVRAAEEEGRSLRAAQALADKYEMLRVIGKGGMGQVWEARDRQLDRRVAIKRLPPEESSDAEARARAIAEAKMLASLHHPGIVDINEVLDLPSGLYLIFELLEGETLQELLARKRRMTTAQAWEILRPVCEALEFAHAKGVVHRDLKPANVMVTKQGFVKVMDFGIARRLGAPGPRPAPEAAPGQGPSAGPELAAMMGDLASTTPMPVPARPSASQSADESKLFDLPVDRTRAIYGTPAYMPPESEIGVVSPATDVFSLGVMYYEMVTGRQPFAPRASEDKVNKNYPRPTTLVLELPPAVDEVIARALEPRYEARLRLREFAILAERLSKERPKV